MSTKTQSFNGSVLIQAASGEPTSVLDQVNASSVAYRPSKTKSMGNVGVKSLRGQSLTNSCSALRRLPPRKKQLKSNLMLDNSTTTDFMTSVNGHALFP